MPKHSFFAPSSADVWMKCGASLFYGNPVENENMKEGSLAHEVAAIFADLSKTIDECKAIVNESLRPYDEDMILNAIGYREHIEKNIVGDRKTVGPIYIEKKVHINKHVFGTLDFGYYNAKDNELHVLDYKYGKMKSELGWQTLIYTIGIGIEIKGGVERELNSFTKIYNHIYQPREVYNETFSVREIAHENLISLKDKVETEVNSVLSGNIAMLPDKHCGRCNGIAKCPGFVLRNDKVIKELTGSTNFENNMIKTRDSMLVDIFKSKSLINKFVKEVEKELYGRVKTGNVKGVKLGRGRGRRVWKTEQEATENVLNQILSNYFTDAYTDKKLKSVAQVEKIIGKKKFQELLGGIVQSVYGAEKVMIDKEV